MTTETRTEHTPGPWEASPARRSIIIQTDDLLIAETLNRVGYDQTNEEAEANARLIAAAPELLARLRVAVATIEDLATRYKFSDADIEELQTVVGDWQSAIAKARGQ